MKTPLQIRPLASGERDLIESLLDHCAFDPANLRLQAERANVWEVNKDGSILRFVHDPSSKRAPVPAIHFVPVEASAMDVDNGKIHILLHIRDGYLYDLEYLKEDGNHIDKIPQASDLIEFTSTN